MAGQAALLPPTSLTITRALLAAGGKQLQFGYEPFGKPPHQFDLARRALQAGTLSGGQQARFQILLLELSGATLLLLDEPTDNLDLVSSEALEAGLAEFQGTVIAVTHDRWFLRSFDRFVVFNDDCTVTDHLDRPAEWR